jgi:hypothetical protein
VSKPAKGSVTEQCASCGEPVVIKRGPIAGRMCTSCRRKNPGARTRAIHTGFQNRDYFAAPPPPKRVVREYVPIYDALGWSIGWLNGSEPKGSWLYLIEVNGPRTFPTESMRYSVMGKDGSQSPSLTDHGCFDSFEAAKRFADTLIPDKADRAEIWDGKRGYMVAVKLCP